MPPRTIKSDGYLLRISSSLMYASSGSSSASSSSRNLYKPSSTSSSNSSRSYLGTFVLVYLVRLRNRLEVNFVAPKFGEDIFGQYILSNY